MTSPESRIDVNVPTVVARIEQAVRASGRDRGAVTLIAVSKTRSAAEVRHAHALGLSDFGENYVQESMEKIAALSDLPLTWHFIGRLQANKTRAVATHFQWVHTLDRLQLAQRLQDQLPADKLLNVCLQVNVDDDRHKGGLALSATDAILELAAAVRGMPGLRLRGLMTILAETTVPALGYRRLRMLFETLASPEHPEWDTLSMGMSGDFETAIAEGATLIRVGQALFGPRPPASTD
ncbi:MAG: YggS family pyridoxal phosphate-dependent enzyme [Pseudomonadales bacterium]|nr:YggS family pyridoxal phosphate-dependent enzyme [Pseudomonadales bacterium]MCP5183420.1 YggS family pyridoxal phosphate-dependent enzyme [Pseudomonadales bacterium]